MAKNPPANSGDAGLISGSGRSPGEENDNPLQDSCLENPMGKGAWWATVHEVSESDMTWQLNNSTIYILAFTMEPHALGGLYVSDHDDEYLYLLCESLSV